MNIFDKLSEHVSGFDGAVKATFGTLACVCSADEHKHDGDGSSSNISGYKCDTITGKVVVLRPPCYYAGDARVLKAVDLGPQAAVRNRFPSFFVLILGVKALTTK